MKMLAVCLLAVHCVPPKTEAPPAGVDWVACSAHVYPPRAIGVTSDGLVWVQYDPPPETLTRCEWQPGEVWR